MAVTADQEYRIVSRLQEFGWTIELLNDNQMAREIAMWAGNTLGYRSRDLNPYTFEYDGRWDGGVFPQPVNGNLYWIGFRDANDHMIYKLKFSS